MISMKIILSKNFKKKIVLMAQKSKANFCAVLADTEKAYSV